MPTDPAGNLHERLRQKKEALYKQRTAEAAAYLQEGQAFLKSHRYVQSRECFSNAASLFSVTVNTEQYRIVRGRLKKLDRAIGIIEAQNYIRTAQNQDVDKTADSFSKAAECYRKAGQERLAEELELKITRMQLKAAGDFAKKAGNEIGYHAIEHLLKAEGLYRKAGDSESADGVKRTLEIARRNINKSGIDLGREYTLQAQKILQDKEDPVRHDRALELLKSAKRYYSIKGDEEMVRYSERKIRGLKMLPRILEARKYSKRAANMRKGLEAVKKMKK